jgi:hypothetical protein
MNDEAIDFDEICEMQIEDTRARAARAGDVFVLHDTTDLSFPRLMPEDVGYLQRGKAGFYLHTSLVIDARGWRRPLGVIHAEAVVRSKARRKNGRSGARSMDGLGKESARWSTGVEASAERLRRCKNVINVMDRGGHSFELMAQMLDSEQHFIIRGRRGRDGKGSAIREGAERCEGVLERDVELPGRAAKSAASARAANTSRKMRAATLRFSATSVVMGCPSDLRKRAPNELTLNLVRVIEVDPPEGAEPVDWLLYTTEPVTTAEQAAAVVDGYRSHWLIGEFFGALKGGSVFEERELDSRDDLLGMLAMSLPVATELLALRSRVLSEPTTPATEVLNDVQLNALGHFSSRKLPTKPTVEEALLSVAAMGGHLKRNGAPGMKVQNRGMTKMLEYEAGWTAALRSREMTRRRT